MIFVVCGMDGKRREKKNLSGGCSVGQEEKVGVAVCVKNLFASRKQLIMTKSP